MTRGEAKGKEGAGHANKENTEEIENDLKVANSIFPAVFPLFSWLFLYMVGFSEKTN